MNKRSSDLGLDEETKSLVIDEELNKDTHSLTILDYAVSFGKIVMRKTDMERKVKCFMFSWSGCTSFSDPGWLEFQSSF
jgi:hypothetical protein